MKIISIIGPKGGIGKTTLSLNLTAILTKFLNPSLENNKICLVDLDLRLPTIASLLDSHPQKTFYDLFETLADKIYQVDFLRNLYQILKTFKGYLSFEITSSEIRLEKSLALYKNLNIDLFKFSDFEFSDLLHELFLYRCEIHTHEQINLLAEALNKIDLNEIIKVINIHEKNSKINIDDYIHYINEYGFSIVGGEVPVLGKKNHRKRINEPEFLLLFLDFLNEIYKKFTYIILDTPAGGVNHLPSLMNFIDQVVFIFDLSNTVAVNGSIDALHSFIDYYEDFYIDFTQDKLTGIDKNYVNKIISGRGIPDIMNILKKKKMGIVFNRYQDKKEITSSLDKLRDYLDTLDKYNEYKKRINIIGMIPQHKIIKITNNLGALFYDKDKILSSHLDMISHNIINENNEAPNLDWNNKDIINYLQKEKKTCFVKKLFK